MTRVFKEEQGLALADVAQWTECQPVNPKVRFPVRAHAWVAGQVPSWGRVRGSQSLYLLHIDVSLPLFLPPFPSPLSKNKISGGNSEHGEMSKCL